MWKTTGPSQEIILPIHEGGTYDFTVNWGDGSEEEVTSHNYPNGRHTYDKAGTYTIVITGKLIGFNFNKVIGSSKKIIEIKEWGNIGFWGELTEEELDKFSIPDNAKYGYFSNCSNLEKITATDAPDLSQTNNLMYLFEECSKFDSDLSHWKTENIVYMQEMFSGANSFNNGGKALTFKTTAVTDMNFMFYNATAFDQDISGWNTAKVTNMDGMFYNATAFNQNLSGWCVKQITTKPSNFDEGGHTDFKDKGDKQPKWGVDCQQ